MELVRRLANHSILLVFFCTILGAAAQVAFKYAARSLPNPSLSQVLTNVPLLAGYGLYGVNTLLLTLALRKGQLSILYPVISLTYVWVAIVSVLLFREQINLIEAAGLVTIVIGVCVLGLERHK